MVIVDDEYPIREMLRQTVQWEKHGINIVGIVDDGWSAIEIIRERNPDLVLTDIRMLNMDGIALSKWISQNYPDVKVIFLSAYRDFENAQMAFKYGVVDYILKPLDEEQLFDVINKVRNEIVKRRAETDQINRMKDIIEDEIPLLHEKYARDLETIFNSMKSYSWLDTEKNINEYFDRCLTDKDINKEYPYIIASELITVLKRLQASNDAFSVCSISKHEINGLKEIKSMEDMKIAVIRIFRLKFDLVMEQRKPSNRNLIDEVKVYIKSHCEGIINVSDIASLIFISTAYLSRLFRKIDGNTFNSYLIQCRMERAKELLLSSDAKIYEICTSSGFGSEKHFIRMFKKQFGISPMQFRKKSFKGNM
jgi:two-component system, response regulator YesN